MVRTGIIRMKLRLNHPLPVIVMPFESEAVTKQQKRTQLMPTMKKEAIVMRKMGSILMKRIPILTGMKSTVTNSLNKTLITNKF
jgi:hypothetical protein